MAGKEIDPKDLECGGPQEVDGNWYCERFNRLMVASEGEKPNCPSTCPLLIQKENEKFKDLLDE